MKTLKQVEQLTGIKADNLRQRIARGTLKADFFVEGDLPNAQRQSGALYELKKLED